MLEIDTTEPSWLFYHLQQQFHSHLLNVVFTHMCSRHIHSFIHGVMLQATNSTKQIFFIHQIYTNHFFRKSRQDKTRPSSSEKSEKQKKIK